MQDDRVALLQFADRLAKRSNVGYRRTIHPLDKIAFSKSVDATRKLHIRNKALGIYLLDEHALLAFKLMCGSEGRRKIHERETKRFHLFLGLLERQFGPRVLFA